MGVMVSKRSYDVAVAGVELVDAAIATGDEETLERALGMLWADAWLAGVRDTQEHYLALAASRSAQPVGLGNRRS